MKPFWETKQLSDMNPEEWESLCDGCGLCCLQKLEDEDTGEVFFTDLACQLLDIEQCRCMDYEHRVERVKACLVLTAGNPEAFAWLPGTCAYRRLANNHTLPAWHPLLTGDPESVHDAGISVRGKVRSERETDQYTQLWKLD